MIETAEPLVATDVTIQRGDLVLCDGVSFSVAAGQVLHVTGNNGMGKSTLLLMLAGVLPVYTGQLTWQSQLPTTWHTLFIGHKTGLNPQLSVLDNLAYLCQLNASSADITPDDLVAALQQVGLAGYEYQPIKTLSSGQTRRVQLARLFVEIQMPAVSGGSTHIVDAVKRTAVKGAAVKSTAVEQRFAKRLWLLDEPFTALDVEMVASLQRCFTDFTRAGGRIVMTSHQAVDIDCVILNLNQIASSSQMDRRVESHVAVNVGYADDTEVFS